MVMVGDASFPLYPSCDLKTDILFLIMVFLDRGNKPGKIMESMAPAVAAIFRRKCTQYAIDVSGQDRNERKGPDVVTLSRVVQTFPIHTIALILSTESDIDIHYLQTFYDLCLPTPTEDLANNQMAVEMCDINLPVGACSIDPMRGRKKRSLFGTLTPKLGTIMPDRKRLTQLESILAMVKRNMNPPKLYSDNVDRTTLGRALYENFVRSAFDTGTEETIMRFTADQLSINEEALTL